MSSFRDKIQKFEQLGKDKSDQTSLNQPRDGKKFFYPGKHSQAQNEPVMIIPQAKVKQNALPDYEADLQEIWSVKKNIHHGNSTKSDTNSNYGGTPNFKFSQTYYSRHGAIPAQPPGDTTQGRFPLGRSWRKRSPLQEQNESSTKTWNLKTPSFSYTECAKRPGQSPTEGDSPPQTKRKFTIREGSPKLVDVPPIRNFFFQSQEKNDKKSQYAQRMIQGHLKSVGMGQYTTEAGYTRHQKANKTVWKKPDDQDEFSF